MVFPIGMQRKNFAANAAMPADSCGKGETMTKEQYLILENYMLSCMEDSAHDAEHIYRVLYNALQIAKDEENVNYDILITACLLHDIGRKEQLEDPTKCHAMVGSEKAWAFLRANGFLFVLFLADRCGSSAPKRGNLPPFSFVFLFIK